MTVTLNTPALRAAAVTRLRPESVKLAACAPLRANAPCQPTGATANVPTVAPEATTFGEEKAVPLPVKGAAGVNVIPVEAGLLIVITSDSVLIVPWGSSQAFARAFQSELTANWISESGMEKSGAEARVASAAIVLLVKTANEAEARL